jgi:Bacterial Ig-like domain
MSKRLHSKNRKFGRRARIAAFAGIIVVAAAAPAFAYWVVSVAYANGNFSLAQADTLPAGATPTAATTPNANSNNVGLTFSTSATTTSGVAVTSYVITRYATGSNTPSATFVCTPPSGSFTCTDLAVPDGSWQYTDAATIAGSNWVGQASSLSSSVVIDTTPPATTVSFPASNAYYNNTSWTAGCNTAPFSVTDSICGTASDPGTYASGVASVAVSLQSTSGITAGKYWGGSSFNQSSEDQLPATYASGNWTLAFPASNFPADGSYIVRVYGTDNDGNVQSPATAVAFHIDNTPPSPSAPGVTASVTYGSNPVWVNEEPVTITDTPTDAGSGVASVTYYYCAGSSGSCTASNGTLIGTSSTSSNNFSVTWNTPLPADGQYQLVATATDIAGNTSAASPSTLIGVDTTPPTVSQPGVNGYL